MTPYCIELDNDERNLNVDQILNSQTTPHMGDLCDLVLFPHPYACERRWLPP